MRKSIITVLLIFVLTLSYPVFACAGQNDNQAPEDAREEAAYQIIKVEKDFSWDSVPGFLINNVLWTEDYGISAGGQLCYDEENLYVHLHTAEKEIRAENTAPLSPVWEDSCLEFFFMIDGADKYFNFEINPNGCLCLQFGPSKSDRINLVRQDDPDYFDIQTHTTEDGWEIYYKIPLRFIQLFYSDYRFKGILLANLYKCGDKTIHPHYLSWSMIELDYPNFHCPEYFGRMQFSGA